MAFAPSRLSDLDVIRAVAHNEALREAARSPEPGEVDIDAIFTEPKRKRHKWGPEKFKGSFVRHASVSVCTKCGLERHRQFDYGQRRMVFRDPKADQWFINKRFPDYDAPTPSCT